MGGWQLVDPQPDITAAVRWVPQHDPEPGPGEVLVDVAACAVCRTDLQLVTGDLTPRRLPVVPGHQVVGRVSAVGPGVAGARVGSRVGVTWTAGVCRRCRFCRSGRENLCVAGRFTGWDRDGGFATALTASADRAFDLPELPGYDSDVAITPLLCGGVIGYRSLRVAAVLDRAPVRLGLFGFGASATVVAQLALHLGCEVLVVTRSRAEVQRARDLGVAWAGTYDDAMPGRLDAAITFAPAGAVVVAALQALDRGGVLAINAISLDAIPSFDYGDLWYERQIRSVANVTADDVREFLALVPVAGVRTSYDVLPLDAAPEALRRLRSGEVRGAAVLQAG